MAKTAIRKPTKVARLVDASLAMGVAADLIDELGKENMDPSETATCILTFCVCASYDRALSVASTRTR